MKRFEGVFGTIEINSQGNRVLITQGANSFLLHPQDVLKFVTLLQEAVNE